MAEEVAALPGVVTDQSRPSHTIPRQATPSQSSTRKIGNAHRKNLPKSTTTSVAAKEPPKLEAPLVLDQVQFKEELSFFSCCFCSVEDGRKQVSCKTLRESNPRCHELTINDGNVGSSTLSELLKWKSLRKLAITKDAIITDAMLSKAMPLLHRLDKLSLDGCAHITSATIDLLAKAQTEGNGGPYRLQSLILSRTRISSLENIPSMISLTYLDISYCSEIGVEHLVPLTKKDRCLTTLLMTGCHMNDEGVAHIAKIRTLHHISFKNCQPIIQGNEVQAITFGALKKLVETCQGIDKLELDGLQLAPEHSAHITASDLIPITDEQRGELRGIIVANKTDKQKKLSELLEVVEETEGSQGLGPVAALAPTQAQIEAQRLHKEKDLEGLFFLLLHRHKQEDAPPTAPER